MQLLQILILIWLVPIPFVFGLLLWLDRKSQKRKSDDELTVDITFPPIINSEQDIIIWYALVALFWPFLLAGIQIKR